MHRARVLTARLTLCLALLFVSGCSQPLPPPATASPLPPTATAPPPVPTPSATAAVAAVPVEAAPVDLTGRWEGTIAVAGMSLAIAVDFTAANGSVSGTLDVPAQGASAIPLHDIAYSHPQLAFAMLSGPQMATFDGQVDADGTIAGKFTQSGMEGTFSLQRPVALAEPELPYRVEEVTFSHGAAQLAGTLTLPAGDGPHPAVVLISGSGQQNRDSELATVTGYRPFQELADRLTRSGMAVLRYDDRGIGGSSGEVEEATSVDFAGDSEAAFAYLQARAEIDPTQVGLLGHSEGGLIAAIVAARNPEVAFLVSLAGPSVSGYAILAKQVERIGRASGLTEDEAAEQAALQRELMDLALADQWQQFTDRLFTVTLTRLQELPASQTAALGNLEEYARQQVEVQRQIFESPWYQFFLRHDPAQDWAQVTAPVLALFGELDTQVDAAQNAAPLESALVAAGNTDVTLMTLPTANHLFQDAQTGGVDEYAALSPALMPAVLETVETWLLNRVTTAAEPG